MDRRRFLLTSLVGALAAPLAAEAQHEGKVWRIGWLTLGTSTSTPNYRLPFVQSLETLGWVEGGNFALERRFAEERSERLPALAVDLVNAKCDVIVALANVAVEAAMKATSTIPIVMVTSLDPVGRGYIKSLARPGGNVTGLSWDVDPKMSEKYLEILRELAPRLSVVGSLLDPFPGLEPYVAAYEAVATRAGVRHPRFIVRQKDDFAKAFAEMERQQVQAVRIYGSTLTSINGRHIAELALRYRLPSISSLSDFPVVGGLMSYGTSLADLFRRAATYVDKILKGAKPAGLPVEQPTKFDLLINLKTAKALGLTIPPSLLARADQVIE